jgi:hypothetical protein
MPKQYPLAWIRLAGNAANIKAKQPRHWRCYVHREPPVVEIDSWELIGVAKPSNFKPGTAPDKDALGLNAWIDIFGFLTVQDGLATIALVDPDRTPLPSAR